MSSRHDYHRRKCGSQTLPNQTTLDEPLGMKLEAQLCFAIHSASNAIDQMYRPLLEAYDLTYTQYIVLMALAERDDVSITELADRLGVSKATMTPLLRRLEDKKLLTRQIEDGNERQKRIKITPEGRAAFSDSCHVTDKVFSKTKLSPDQAGDLIALCKEITKQRRRPSANGD